MAIPDKAAVDAATDAAFAAEGYVCDDGTRDMPKVRQLIVEELRVRKVLNLKERATKAITRGDLVAHLFPSTPADSADSPDPELAREVWNALDKVVWGGTTGAPNSALQQMVGYVMGNGYVLCRTKLAPNNVDALYISDDVPCIQADYVKPIFTRLENANKAAIRAHEMLIQRKPDVGARFARGLNSQIRNLQVTADSQIKLALEASKPAAADGDDSDED